MELDMKTKKDVDELFRLIDSGFADLLNCEKKILEVEEIRPICGDELANEYIAKLTRMKEARHTLPPLPKPTSHKFDPPVQLRPMVFLKTYTDQMVISINNLGKEN
jgi:hypothetical protein